MTRKPMATLTPTRTRILMLKQSSPEPRRLLSPRQTALRRRRRMPQLRRWLALRPSEGHVGCCVMTGCFGPWVVAWEVAWESKAFWTKLGSGGG